MAFAMQASRTVLRSAQGSARMLSTVGELLDKAAASYPHKEILRIPDQDVRWNFSNLKNQTDALARGLLELGVDPGMTISIALPNNAENAVVNLAAAKAGCVVANADADADVFIYDPTVSNGETNAEFVLSTGFDRIEPAGHRLRDILVYNNDAIKATVDGKTPLKKEGAAVLTHADVIKSGKSLVSSLKLGSTDRILAKSPDTAALVGCFDALATVVIPGEDADQTAKIENVTHTLE